MKFKSIRQQLTVTKSDENPPLYSVSAVSDVYYGLSATILLNEAEFHTLLYELSRLTRSEVPSGVVIVSTYVPDIVEENDDD